MKKTKTAKRAAFRGAAFAGVLLAPALANAAFIKWQTRAHSGDITADTPSHPHTSAGYVAAWNAIAANAATTGYGDGGFDDWTSKNNQNTIPSGANGNYGLHASFTFNVPANDTGTWTFNIGNDADFGGTALLDGTELATAANGYYPNGPSGSRFLGAGLHTVDVYSFEGCCDGPATTTYTDPLNTSGTPKTVNSTNLSVPEPVSAGLLALGGLGLLARRRKV